MQLWALFRYFPFWIPNRLFNHIIPLTLFFYSCNNFLRLQNYIFAIVINKKLSRSTRIIYQNNFLYMRFHNISLARNLVIKHLLFLVLIVYNKFLFINKKVIHFPKLLLIICFTLKFIFYLPYQKYLFYMLPANMTISFFKLSFSFLPSL